MHRNFKKVGPDPALSGVNCQLATPEAWSGRPIDRRAAEHPTSLKELRQTRGCPALPGDKVDRRLPVL